MSDGPRVLVLGAYGLIGSEICRRLVADGMSVVGLGRGAPGALPVSDWVTADLRDMVQADEWASVLEGITHVVNAAGVLQDGAVDDVQAVHVEAPRAMAEACATRAIAVVQISAAGVSPEASTAFFRTKAEGDAALVASGAEAYILRPTLVLARESYGGTALVRMVAAVPWVQPLALGGSKVQIVDVDDVTVAVVKAIRGELPPGTYDLSAPEVHSLEDVVLAVRGWLGVEPPLTVQHMPGWQIGMIARLSDLLGRLGWRSPLRTTALTVLRDGIAGDGTSYAEATGHRLNALSETLAKYPATTADLTAARVALLLPVLIALLCIFWVMSGVIGLVRLEQASDVLVNAGWPPGVSAACVLVFSLVDIALGAALLVRRWAKVACIGMIVVSLGYLAAGTGISPELWNDPLGPLLKIVPGVAAALACLVALGTRR